MRPSLLLVDACVLNILRYPALATVHVEFFKSIIRCTRCGNIIDPMPVSIVQVSTPSFWSVLLSSRFWAALKSSSKTRIVFVARYARNLST